MRNMGSGGKRSPETPEPRLTPEQRELAFVAAFCLWVLWPWIIGLVDLISFILVGSTITNIWSDTNEWRLVAAALWPIVWLGVILVFSALANA